MIISLTLGAILIASLYFNYKLYNQITHLEDLLQLKFIVRELNIKKAKKEIEVVKPAKKRGRPRKEDSLKKPKVNERRRKVKGS
jgi:hypothetical protein